MDDSGTDIQCFRRPEDGAVVPLVVQHFEDLDPDEAYSWERVGKPVSELSLLAVISSWVWSSHFTQERLARNRKFAAACKTAARATIAAPLVLILTIWPFAGSSAWIGTGTRFPKAGRVKASARDRFYNGEDHARSTAAVIPYSDDLALAPQHRSTAMMPPSDLVSTSLRPRYLCFLNDSTSGYETRNVREYLRQHGDHTDTEFIFISYTRLQFRVATREELDNHPYDDQRIRDANIEIARKDRETLIRWGIDAAKAAGKRAFWLDFECVRDADGVARSNSSSDDVYRICDVVRAAHSMIIAIGPPVEERIDLVLSGVTKTTFDADRNETKWLQQWGSRLWTLPEILLCPSEYRIKLFTLDGERRAMAKRNFAERAWADAESVKALVDHFEGSAILPPLQFLEAALECFARRKTSPYSPGDIAYSIMGLFAEQQRPPVRQSDTGFQAFARLVLLNDCGFLERLLCVLPLSWDKPWYDTKDIWSAKLRDFTPKCHVLDVASHPADTLLLNGVKVAYIQWDRLCPVPRAITQSGKNFLLLKQILFVIHGFCFMAFFIIINTRSNADTDVSAYIVAIPIIMCFVWIAAVLVGPYLLFNDARDAKHYAPMLFGIEGVVDAATVERYLLGFPVGRFTAGQFAAAQLSPRGQGAAVPRTTSGAGDGELVGEESQSRLFSLVDTKTMTITQIRARNPPTALFICGEEKGMARGLLCSYDWATATYHRETIVRLPFEVLEGINQVENVQISLTPMSAQKYSEERPSNSRASSQEPTQSSHLLSSSFVRAQKRPKFEQAVPIWVLDLSILPILLNYYNINGGDFLSYVEPRGAIFMSVLCLWLSNCIAQVLVYFALRHTNAQKIIQMILITMVLANFILLVTPALTVVILGTQCRSCAYPVISLQGVAYGMLSHILVILLWCWYTPRQMTVRLILVLLFSKLVAAKFDIQARLQNALSRPTDGSLVYFGVLLAAVAFIGYCVFIFYYVHNMGVPLHTNKFPTHQQLGTARKAAVRTAASRGPDARLSQRMSRNLNGMQLPEKMIRMFVIFALTFVVVFAVNGREMEVGLFARICTILVVFPGVLISCLLHWRHGLGVSAAAWYTGTAVVGVALLSLLDIAPLQYSMKLLLWVALGLEAGDLDTAKMSLSSSMLGHYCGWTLPFLIAGVRWQRRHHNGHYDDDDDDDDNNSSSLGIRVALFGAQVLLWTALGALFHLRERRGHGKRGRYNNNNDDTVSSSYGGGDDGGNIDPSERQDGEPGVEI